MDYFLMLEPMFNGCINTELKGFQESVGRATSRIREFPKKENKNIRERAERG